MIRQKIVLLLCMSAVLSACSVPQPRGGAGIHNKSFKIAGGETISLPMSDAGPIGAENDKAKVLVAGFVVGPSKEKEKQAILAWSFDLEAKPTLKNLEAVKVEEVAPSKIAITLIEDNTPVLKDGVWSGNASPIPANQASIPWLFSNERSEFVFRLTIKPVGEPSFVLYQPAWFSSAAKQGFRKIIEHVEHD